jgi:hypothetical protein
MYLPEAAEIWTKGPTARPNGVRALRLEGTTVVTADGGAGQSQSLGSSASSTSQAVHATTSPAAKSHRRSSMTRLTRMLHAAAQPYCLCVRLRQQQPATLRWLGLACLLLGAAAVVLRNRSPSAGFVALSAASRPPTAEAVDAHADQAPVCIDAYRIPSALSDLRLLFVHEFMPVPE